MQVKKKKNSNILCNFLLLLQFLHEIYSIYLNTTFASKIIIKQIAIIINFNSLKNSSYFFKLPKYFSELSKKRNPIFIRPFVGFAVCNSVMDHLFVNNTVHLLVQHITQWGQYGRCTQSLCSSNGCAGCMLGGPQ